MTEKKLNKKDLKEDQVVTSVDTSIEWIIENWKQVSVVLGVIVGIVIVGYFYKQSIDSENEEAAAKIARVMPIYDQGSYVEAANGREGTNIEGFKSIADEFGGVEQGEVAKVYAANSLYFNGNYTEALEYYADYSGSDLLFKATAIAGVAACNEALKNYAKAGDKYYEAANVSKANVSNAAYLISAGINYIKADKKEKALEAFETVVNDYKGSVEKREADKYIATLK